MSIEAYSVAIRLRLIDSVSSGLISMAGQFAAFNRHVNASQANLKELEGQLKRIKMMGFLGGAALGVGAAGLYAFRGPLEEARLWQQETAKFASLGFGARVNADAQQFAKGMQTYGTSARDNLILLGDAMSVFKDLSHAELAAPILAKMKFGNQAVFGAEGGAANERQFLDMLKVIELRRGLLSPQEFATQANFVQKAISGSRGRVNASQWLQLLRTGGVGVSQLGNEAFYLGLEPILQEMGGQRTGQMLMSVYQNLVQARGTITSQQELYRLGLLDPKKVQFNKLGMLKKALPGAFYGHEIYEREGPLALLEKVLIPAFAAHGITTEPQILLELGTLLSNRNASNLLGRVYQQRTSIAFQSAANRNAMGIDQLSAAGENTFEGKWLNMTKQWKSLMLELGTAVLPIATRAVSWLTGAIKEAVAFAREFPMLTKGLVIAFGVLAGLVAVGGAVTLATAGFRALGLALLIGKGVGLGGMLLTVATGFARIAAPITALVGLFIALDHFLPRTGSWKALDSWSSLWKESSLSHLLSGDRGASLVATPSGKASVTHVQVNLDGHKVGSVVAKTIAKQAGAPQTGISTFDGRMALTPAGH